MTGVEASLDVERGVDALGHAARCSTRSGNGTAHPRGLRKMLAPGALLPLAGGFLQLLVGHEKIGGATVPGESKPIDVGQLGVVRRSNPAERSVIGEVVFDRRIEIAIRAHAADALIDSARRFQP